MTESGEFSPLVVILEVLYAHVLVPVMLRSEAAFSLAFSRQQVADYVQEFDDHYHEMLTYLPVVDPAIGAAKRQRRVLVQFLRPDGSVFKQNMSELEACEMFLVRSREYLVRNASTWSLFGDRGMILFYGRNFRRFWFYLMNLVFTHSSLNHPPDNVISQLTPSLNSSYADVFIFLEDEIASGLRVSLTLLLSGFVFLVLLLVTQVVVSMRTLSSKNAFALKAAIMVPPTEISAMKRLTEERWSEISEDDDGGKVREVFLITDDDEDVSLHPPVCHGSSAIYRFAVRAVYLPG